MAKRVVWSRDAQLDKLQILQYWARRLGNKTYSAKLEKRFYHAASLVGRMQGLGKRVRDREERAYIAGDYELYYKIYADFIEILRVWDTRRNPEDLKL